MIGPQPFPQPFAPPVVGMPHPPVNPTPSKQEEPREHHLPKYINYLADYSGCGHWRILWPEAAINARGDGMSQSTTAMVSDPRWYTGVKAVKLQRQASEHQKEFALTSSSSERLLYFSTTHLQAEGARQEVGNPPFGTPLIPY